MSALRLRYSWVTELLALGNDVMGTSISQMCQRLSGMAGRVVDLFKKGDTNRDGTISREEFVAAMPLMGLSGNTPTEIHALFDSFDPDGSGAITFRELYKQLRQGARASMAVPTPKAKPVAKPAEPLLDLSLLRQRSLAQLDEMGFGGNLDDVLSYHRSRGIGKNQTNTAARAPVRTELNPTIGNPILAAPPSAALPATTAQ